MKKIIASLSLLAASLSFCHAQNWQVDSFTVDGKNRKFKTYHANPTQQNMSVVLILHGLGGTMNDVDITNLKEIADTANLLLVSPEALDYTHPIIGSVGNCWNSGVVIAGTIVGDVPLNPTVDDVKFLTQLLDSVKLNYDVDPTRIYVAGFSNGGFMTQRLLCEHPELFRAAASLSGTKALTLNNCVQNVPVPIAHFHGTNDEVVDHLGNFHLTGFLFPIGLSAHDLVDYWREINDAELLMSEELWGDPTAYNYIKHYLYGGSKRVEYFEIVNGAHQWYSYANTSDEFDLGTETWHFFLRADHNGLTGIRNQKKAVVGIYPNPAGNQINISSERKYKELRIINLSGAEVMRMPFAQNVDVSALIPGFYLLQLKDENGSTTIAKFAKN